MAWNYKRATFKALGGVDTLNGPADIPQHPGDEGWKNILHFAKADNCFQPNGRYDIQTRPGMSDVRASPINANGVITGMHYQSDIAERFIVSCSVLAGTHDLYQDNASPASVFSGGTGFTVGQDNLISMMNFADGTNQGTICMSLLRDTPQFVTSAGSRGDFTITGSMKPKFGAVFLQRALYASPTVSSVTYGKRVYRSDLRDGNLFTDIGTQFETFETSEGGDITAIRPISEVCMVGLKDHVFLLANRGASASSANPFAQRELPTGKHRGPIGHFAVVEAESALWWMGQTNIHSMDLDGKIRDHGDRIKPTIAALEDERRPYTIAGYDPDNSLILFAVSSDTATTNDTVMALNIKTGAVYPNWTLSVNAMAQRLVNGDARLILGGYTGFYRNWNSGTTGSGDDSAALIDADLWTPRHHLGAPGLLKNIIGVEVVFNPQGSESVTVQYRMDDTEVWTTPDDSPYTVTATAGDEDVKFFPINEAGNFVQIRFRDANSGDVLRIQEYTICYKLARQAVR